jgi:hypothetical protein
MFRPLFGHHQLEITSPYQKMFTEEQTSPFTAMFKIRKVIIIPNKG